MTTHFKLNQAEKTQRQRQQAKQSFDLGYRQLKREYSKLSTTILQSLGSLNFMQPFASKRLLANLQIVGA
ncbi:MAG: hypothetical protein KME18_26165, partial [Phormidium tanganyikae FI6-MK23]|nr:hypothetical protein [Phormidium tanganyikae FI6-MK23]